MNAIKKILLIITFTLTSRFALNAAEPTKGIDFTGDQAYQAIIPDKSISLNPLTLAAWIKTSFPEKSQGILGVGTPAQFFTLYLYNEGVRMLVENDREKSTAYAHAFAPLPEKEKWTHYCGTFDGQTIRVYCNGKLAQEKEYSTKLTVNDFNGKILWIGGVEPKADRAFEGQMNDLAIWNDVLTDKQIEQIYQQGAKTIEKNRVALWTNEGLSKDQTVLKPIETPTADQWISKLYNKEPLLNRKDTGYRGIWYYNQKINNEYVYKYSGGMGTYPANHYPFSVYCPKVDKTFFCYGGTDPTEKTLWHEVGVFDHKTKKVSRPTIIVDKKTEDAHDNPVMSIDDAGHIWVFSTSHGTGRPSFIHKSVRPYDVSEFERINPTKLVDGKPVPMTNFSYVQMWNVPERGFFSFFTTYDQSLVADVDPSSNAQRLIAFMSSPDGIKWSKWTPLAAIEIGHYQNACVRYDHNKKANDGKPVVKIGTSFNYHPAVAKGNRGTGLNWRTNLYYMESDDLGQTWHTIEGKPLDIPILNSDSPAKVYDYESENLNVYITDTQYDANGYPIIAYVTSKGFESGPEMGPRVFHTAHWNGKSWDFAEICVVDNNYEYAMFYPEESQNGIFRIVGAFEDGPQAYNTGGEISQWISVDSGTSWEKEFQLTQNSDVNQSFPRRTIDAHPDFYAFWAEGNGREKSVSSLRFSTKDGRVYALPREMKEDWEEPILVRKAEKEIDKK